jgi:hypothetical protein
MIPLQRKDKSRWWSIMYLACCACAGNFEEPMRLVIDWQDVTLPELITEPSLQVVAHSLLMRNSPIHDRAFALLRELAPRYARYVPWLPTPQLSVAELYPPNETSRSTSWNFTLLDEQFLDFWEAVQGNMSEPIPNFATQPTWLYNTSDWSFSAPCTPSNGCLSPGYTRGTAPARNAKELGDYYGRLLAWYTRGGFTDEFGQRHASEHWLNITIWEVFNEVDHEHWYTPEAYTRDFDAVVHGIRSLADPEKRIRFVGMNLPNVDNETVLVEWASYFLNASNHAAEARDALNYIGYHSYPTAEYFPNSSDDTYSRFFDYADRFMLNVEAVERVRARLSPETRTFLDESGNDHGLRSIDEPLYFVASGSHWAYLFARSAMLGDAVKVVGQSQLMDDPLREPAVTILDWRTGNPTAKYWVMWLLRKSMSAGDAFVKTQVACTGEAPVFAQAYLHKQPGGTSKRSILLINKRNWVTSLMVGEGCNALVVDATTHESPPRSIACDQQGVFSLPPYATAILTLPTSDAIGNDVIV